jgi:hypothetical protein
VKRAVIEEDKFLIFVIKALLYYILISYLVTCVMSQRRPRIQLQPVNWVQRIALYVTESRYYLIGSNNTQTAFKVLKIDRTDNELSLIDDRVEYTYDEIRDLLIRIDHGNRIRPDQPGVVKTVSSFGLLGFVRFLHGYYLILIIKRRKVASIGYHTIYKVEDTRLVYIPNRQPVDYVSEEARYVRAFNSVDLKSNFYFSYSYDTTHSLQYNLSPIRGTKYIQEFIKAQQQKNDAEQQKDDRFDNQSTSSESQSPKQDAILIKTKPFARFVWNSHLIDFEDLHDDWKVYLIHGFVAQANICVHGKPIYLTLIARRSRFYCGTRFLKRGLNLNGDVANEVETEQIIHDASVSDFTQGFFTSFVQMRGSMPDRWSQDVTKIVAKPQINQDYVDPYHEPTAKHFNDLLGRYGSPIVVLNLVKKKEKKPHESILNDMLTASIGYLNQFLPQQHVIKLIAFDMARYNKSKSKNVMNRLGKIGFNIVRVTGIFQSWRSARRTNYDNTYTLHLRQRTFTRKPSSSRIGGYRLRNGQCLQNGIVRVNCVDSLDRTNTAQFVLGKVALAFQLQALGVLIEPHLEYDTDAVRLLEQLYEDHGDTIALQYGGSQLVHRVKTYRKIAPITSHSSEIMQTLSRYYSNTFSDAEKQNVINLFLGVRKALPTNAQSILNNMAMDIYLHNQLLLEPFDLKTHRLSSYRQWWNRAYLKSLPRAYNEYEKEGSCYKLEIRDDLMTLTERIDYFNEAYRPYEFTHLSNSFNLQILNTIRDYMPSGAKDESPFCLRTGPGKLKEVYLKSQSNKKLPPNPSVYGLPSSSSSASSELSFIDSDDGSEDGSLDDLSTHPTAMNTSSFLMANNSRLSVENARADLNSRFHSSGYPMLRYLSEPDVYSIEEEAGGALQTTDLCRLCESKTAKTDLELYKNYINIGRTNDSKVIPSVAKYAEFFDLLSALTDSTKAQEYETIFKSVITPTPSETDFKLYCNYVSGSQVC